LSIPLLEAETWVRFVLALGIVLGLLGATAWGLRRLALGLPLAGGLGRPRRLSLVETIALDHRRRLVLVRRDGTEHLLLLGLTGEQVIESTIVGPGAGAGAAAGPGPKPGGVPPAAAGGDPPDGSCARFSGGFRPPNAP